MADYSEQIEQHIKELFYEDWMHDEDWQTLLKELREKVPEFTNENMSKQIQIGIDNGHSIEFQFELSKKMLTKYKR